MKKTIRLLLSVLVALGSCHAVHAQGGDPTLEKIRQARYVASSPKVQSLGLLHYSDIHGDDTSVKMILEAISKYEPYIDAVINTGDVVHYYAEPSGDYKHAALWWKGTGLPEKSLFVLGNHDGAVRSDSKGHLDGSADWDFMGKEWDFDTYFGDYVGTLGYKMPQGYDNPSSPYYKSCFWYKDFDAAKVRIIGLDCIHYNDSFRYLTNEQEDWLKATLAETLVPGGPAEGYSVIIMCHYPIDDYQGDNEVWDEPSHRFKFNVRPQGGRVMDHRTGSVVNFHSYPRTSLRLDKRFSVRKKVPLESARYGYEKGDFNPLADIVQSWVDDGGKFVAWISGHCHADLMFYSEYYPDLLCVAVDQAGNLRGNSLTDRAEGSESRACANFYSVDTQNGLFKIVRVGGLRRDRFMVEKDVLCYDYINKQVVFE